MNLLRKKMYFRLISWCRNFLERDVFRMVGAIRLKLCGNCAFLQNSHTRKLGEITVFYAAINLAKISYYFRKKARS